MEKNACEYSKNRNLFMSKTEPRFQKLKRSLLISLTNFTCMSVSSLPSKRFRRLFRTLTMLRNAEKPMETLAAHARVLETEKIANEYSVNRNLFMT